jgi:hypothetical protein
VPDIITITMKTVVASPQMDLALRIAIASGSIRKAALETGISRRKIRETLQLTELQEQDSKQKVRALVKLRKSNPLMEQMTNKAINMGVEKASEEVKDRVLSLVDVLYTTAEEALEKTRIIVKLAGTDNPLDDWRVQQLKLLTDVWGTAIRSGQILKGMPVGEGKGDTINYNTIDARSIILSRVDKISASEN